MKKTKQRPKVESKLIEALKDAVDEAQENVKRSPFEVAKERLIAAITEINASLEQCHGCADMRVFISATKKEGEAARFRPQVYRLDYSQMELTVSMREPAWRVMKDPSFQEVAGKGLR